VREHFVPSFNYRRRNSISSSGSSNSDGSYWLCSGWYDLFDDYMYAHYIQFWSF
jgi:hypothetical protein